jgi:hypothetical protein
MNIQPKRGHQSDHRSERCNWQFSLTAIQLKKTFYKEHFVLKLSWFELSKTK